MHLAPRGSITPLASAVLISILSASIASTNRSGEKGSPCRRPLAWQIRRPGEPLRMIFVLAVERISEIQFSHLLENTICLSTSSRNVQSRQSKDLEISILYKALGIFLCGTEAGDQRGVNGSRSKFLRNSNRRPMSQNHPNPQAF